MSKRLAIANYESAVIPHVYIYYFRTRDVSSFSVILLAVFHLFSAFLLMNK